MVQLCYMKELSPHHQVYAIPGVRVSVGESAFFPEEQAHRILQDHPGCFRRVGHVAPLASPAASGAPLPDLPAMTVSRLRAYAEESGIKLRSKKKAAIVAEIEAAFISEIEADLR